MTLTIIILILALSGSFMLYLRSNGNVKPNDALKSVTIHGFKVPGLAGATIDFAEFKGKKIMVVNTASKCGLTPQYEALERIYRKYGDRLVVVGFPSNDFLFQEPGTDADIAEFCRRNYGVSFPMAAKVEVKGRRQAPVYQWLTNKRLNGIESSAVTWNFQKYVLDENGKLVRHFSPQTDPDDPEIIKWIESAN